MDMSSAEVKRAPSSENRAQPNSPQFPLSSDPNGSEILVRCLQAEGVNFLWGYPGGAVLYIYDALYKQDTIQHVLVRHEQAAVHAAEQRLRQTLAQVPPQAGPLNSHHLVHRALATMQEVSPAYLQRFVTHVEALLWMERRQASANPAAARLDKPRKGGRR